MKEDLRPSAIVDEVKMVVQACEADEGAGAVPLLVMSVGGPLDSMK
jgi:hypothetical protein